MPPESNAIAPSIRSAHETRIATLSTGGQLLVWSVRRWVAAANSRECALQALAAPYRLLNCTPAVPLLDECLCLVALAATHPVAIRCLCSTTLSDDELLILRALQRIGRRDECGARAAAGCLVAGRIAHAFVRAAAVYVDELRSAGLFLDSTPDLKLVASADA